MTRISNLIREIFARHAADCQARQDALAASYRLCPATAGMRMQKNCSACLGTICAKMLARGLDDDGHPLPNGKRPECDAKARSGRKCRNRVVPGRTKCRFHGGASTGPRTAEGRARIAEAQRKRWRQQRSGGEKL